MGRFPADRVEENRRAQFEETTLNSGGSFAALKRWDGGQNNRLPERELCLRGGLPRVKALTFCARMTEQEVAP